MSILEVLAEKKIISPEDIPAILDESENGNLTIDQILLRRGVSQDDLMKYKSEFQGIPTRSLTDKEIPTKILEYIPEESAGHYGFVPIGVKDGVLEVGIVDPDNICSCRWACVFWRLGLR